MTPKPYTDTEIDRKREELQMEYYADLWDEAAKEVNHDPFRDKRIAQAIINQDANELGNIFMDQIQGYIDRNYIEPKLAEWINNWKQNQIDEYSEIRRERYGV